jgi:hypothetical protein
MNRTEDVATMTMKAPPDVRMHLERWASENFTSMNAEFVRSVRDRASQERLERVKD